MSRQLRSPPGPSGRLALQREQASCISPLEVLRTLVERYGDVVRFSTPFNTFTLVNHPMLASQVLGSHDFVRGSMLKTILGNGLLAADGPYWERQRRAMLPEFRPAKVESLIDLFREVTIEHCKNELVTSVTASGTNLNRLMDRIALSNISRSLFGADIDASFLDAFRIVMTEIGTLGNAADFGLPLIRTPETNRNFNAAMKVVEDAVQAIVNAPCSHASGILAALKSRDVGTGKALSPRQLRDEIVTMITAGHETTAVSLSWIWFVVLSHASLADEFYAEIDRELAGRPITAADISKLVWTRKIISETFRLYPPVWLIGRTALRDTRVGDYDIPANTAVLISPFLLHRDPRYWPHPEQFDPERFDGGAVPENGSYIPFLSGRHLCIGKYFALTEITVVLATLVQQYQFRLIEFENREFEPLVSLRMKNPLIVDVTERNWQPL